MNVFLHLLLGGGLILTSLFLILLVLVQRGRGGGLAGALGGAGGSSALGTKAGDMFTRITIGAVLFWILLCIATMLLLRNETSQFGGSDTTPAGPPGLTAPTDDEVPGDTGSGIEPPPADLQDGTDEATEGTDAGAIGEGAAQTAAPTP